MWGTSATGNAESRPRKSAASVTSPAIASPAAAAQSSDSANSTPRALASVSRRLAILTTRPMTVGRPA
jgi:hypothetical protein